MKLKEILRQRRHRPALIMGVVMLVHVWFFSVPKLRSAWFGLWGQPWFDDMSVDMALLFVLAATHLLCLLAGLSIWFLSVFVTWAAFRKSRKKAYIFILAYFLLPLVVQPVTSLNLHWSGRQPLEREMQQAVTEPAFAEAEPAPRIEKRQVERYIISSPIGPLLLLAGIWYLYKREKNAEQL